MYGNKRLQFSISLLILLLISGDLYNQIKIAPIGNSITRGVSGSQNQIGFRRALHILLTGNGYNVDFIGSLTTGIPTDFGRNHEGHSGWVADGPINSIADNVYTWLTQRQTDIVLLEIGTNDINGGDNATQVVQDVETILNEIDRYENNAGRIILVILAKITNRNDVLVNSTQSQTTTAFNNGLQTLYQNRITSPSPDNLLIVDMENGAGIDYHLDNTTPFNNGDMYDNLHPNDSGYVKLAANWYNILKTVLTPLQSSPLALLDPFNGSAGQSTSLLLDWAPYSGASSYRLQVASDIFFNSIILDQDNISLTSYNVTGLNQGQKYYWRVIAKSSTTNLFYSDVWNFTTQSQGGTSGMISYWKLDETSGSAYTDQLGLNNAFAITAPTPVTGRVNGAQQFNGSNSKIDVPANSSYNFASNGNFSVEFWYKGTTIPSTSKSAVGRYMGSKKWWIGLNANDGKARFYMSSGGSSMAINGTVLTDGNWHHVAATRNGTTGAIKLYVDGVQRASTTKSFPDDFASTTANLNLGWYSAQSVYTLPGILDEVAIHNTVLSSSEITEHYNNGLNGQGYIQQTQTAPVITSSPITSGQTNQQYQYDVNATGNPAPTYSLTTFPSGMTINSSTGLIQWTPSSTGNYNVTVQASNGINPAANQSFTIAVSSSGSSPLITSTAVQSGIVGQLYSYDVNTTGNPAPTYSLTTFPSGMTINSTSGLIQWTPTSVGNYNVTVKASNGISPDAQQSFTIAVNEASACPPGMISYWKLDETSGTTYVDELGINNAVATSAPIPVTGKVNGAQQFNGNTSGIDVPANSSFNFSFNGNFSVEFWYKGTSIPSTSKSAIGRYMGSKKWWIGLNANDGKARFYMSSGGASMSINGIVITDGTWHHVAATRNGTTGACRLYVDGVQRASTTKSFPDDFASVTANLNIGWYNFQSVYALPGVLDEVAIYNIELAAADIQQHYSSGAGYCNAGLGKITMNSSLPFEQFSGFMNNNKIRLLWLTSIDSANGFEIERKDEKYNNWKKIDFLKFINEKKYEYEDKSNFQEGSYTYRIKLIKNDGGYVYSEEVNVSLLPIEYHLFQNYPNPFNPTTTIKFSLPEFKRVTIKIYNQLGEEVTELTNKDYEAGSYDIEFNAGNLASGIYFYRMETRTFTDTKKFILVK